MRTLPTGAQWLVRITGIIEIVLGFAFWAGQAESLISVHMLLGLLLVLGLWTVAIVALRGGVPMGLVAGGLIWGLLVLVVGLTQQSLLPGSTHWVVQVIHLLLGIGAIGLAEMLGARLRRATV